MVDNDVPTDEQIRTEMEILIKTVDLNVISVAQFIAALSDKLGGADLSAKKEFIKDNITEILDEMEIARDKKLFEQPMSTHLGECPLCFLPMPTDKHQIIMNSCCSKLQCNGCAYAHQKHEMSLGLEQSCAFCRKPLQKNKEEEIANKMERVEAMEAVESKKSGRTIDDNEPSMLETLMTSSAGKQLQRTLVREGTKLLFSMLGASGGSRRRR